MKHQNIGGRNRTATATVPSGQSTIIQVTVALVVVFISFMIVAASLKYNVFHLLPVVGTVVAVLVVIVINKSIGELNYEKD